MKSIRTTSTMKNYKQPAKTRTTHKLLSNYSKLQPTTNKLQHNYTQKVQQNTKDIKTTTKTTNN